MAPSSAVATLAAKYVTRFPSGAARTIESRVQDFSPSFFAQLGAIEQAALIQNLSSDTAGSLIRLGQPDLDEICKFLDPGVISRIIVRMPADHRATVLQSTSEQLRKELQFLMNYPEGVAGALMSASVISFNRNTRISSVLDSVRRFRKAKLTDVYVYDDQQVLIGKVSLQNLLGFDDEQILSDVMASSPAAVNDMAPRDEVVEVAERYKLSSLPVVNAEGVLVGVVRYTDLITLVHEEAIEGMQKMVGVSPNENALSPAFVAVKKRFPWLSVNLVTTFIAAAVVAIFEDTIAKVSALAVLLPVVAGQSGNTGAQALAITMRGLALREIRSRHKWRILRKEALAGFSNGALIGFFCLVAVYFWSGSMALAGVIGVSMVMAMVAASLSGAGIPLLLNALGLDPAASSSIILTTITDIVGFLSFLGLATLFSSYLV